MTNETYTLLKADFLREYGKTLCAESLADVQAAATVDEFIEVLHKYITYARLKPFPTAKWVRKWFANELHILNSHGVYLDQITNILDDKRDSFVFFGKCHIIFTSLHSQRCTFLVQDESVLNIVSFGISLFSVRLKGKGECKVTQKDSLTQVKIHKI